MDIRGDIMNTWAVFAMGSAAKAAGKPLQKLDWDGLKKFVDENKEKISSVYAGLVEDWEWTGDEVYCEEFGWLDNTGAYTESIWATPIAYIHYKSGYDGPDEFTDTIFEENK